MSAPRNMSKQAERIATLERDLAAAQAACVALRQALNEDIADGENVPGLTLWLGFRTELYANTKPGSLSPRWRGCA